MTKTKRKKLKSLKHIRKLSALLALALKDLRKQERTKGCAVNMGCWWRPKRLNGEQCVACLAGSVMRWSLQKPQVNFLYVRWEIIPESYDDATANRLYALNLLRRGNVIGAAERMGLETSVNDRPIIYYDQVSQRQWWTAIKQLLADLRAAGE